MKNKKLIAVFNFLILLWLPSAGAAQTKFAGEMQVVSQADQYLNELVRENRFSGTVLLARNGKIVLSKGYGLANRETGTPNTTRTKIRLGSLTKQFTAVGVLMLEERGKLSVEDSICKYVENCPAAWQAITLRRLLNHTSGIPNYTNLPGFKQFTLSPATPLEIIAQFKNKPLEFAPGTQFNYSNSGYALLGFVIEKVSGKSYADFLRENIFTPLGMTNSDYDDSDAVIPNRAAGYTPTPRGLRNAPYTDMTVPFAAGGLYSTAEDLYRWQQGLIGGKLISQKSLALMETPFKENYGYGVSIEKQYNLKVVTHGGAINGAATVMTRFPGEDAVVIVLSNIDNVFAGGYGKRLAGILLDDKLNLPKVIETDSTVFKQYEGRYQVRPETPTEDVYVENGRLKIKISGSDEIELLPVGKDEFVMSYDFEARYVFNRDAGGKVVKSTFHYGDYRREVNRLQVVPSLTGNTTFRLKNFPNARYVNLAGSFNDWKTSVTACGREGADWLCRIDLKPGKYFYKFIVDGDWMIDPANSQTEDDGSGNVNSVRNVSPGTDDASQPDVSGKWSGNFDLTFADGKSQHETAWFDLKQLGGVVTGTAGASAEKQTPITDGKINGRRVRFKVEVRSETILEFNLILEDGHLKGEASGDPSGAQIKIDVVPANPLPVAAPTTAENLYDEIFRNDRQMFEAFNNRDLDKFKSFFAEDLEFYQDLTGLTLYRQNVETFKINFAKEAKIRRELDEKSLEVYPIKDYGAIELGTHRFYTAEKNQPEKLTAEVKFVHVWRKKDGVWKISRAVSYGH